MTKICSMCGKNRKLKFFARNSLYSKGRYCWCEDCVYDRSKLPASVARRKRYYQKKAKDPVWRKKELLRNRLRQKSRRHKRQYKEWTYQTKYGVSLRRFESVVRRQKGRCKLCRRKRRLCADHIHGERKFRGAICWPCNLFVGQVETVPGFFLRIKKYLRGRR